jgi:5-methyltetrahydrofolate--homocysteine methyltransferase
METRVGSATKTVLIGGDRPTVLIGERINPTGKKKLAAALRAGNLEIVRREALAQAEAGADILDVNVGAAEVDEVALLPEAVRVVMEAVDAPLSIDSANPAALRAALEVYRRLAPEGKPIVNSVNGEERSLSRVLPLVKEYGTAVIGLTMDEGGILNEAEERVAVAHKIVARAEALGIPREDVIIDCLALTVSTDRRAALVTLETIRRVREEWGVNMTLGASNVSFGLPEREVINGAFLAMAIAAGVTCPIVDAARVRPVVLAVDLLLGRDEYAMRYLRAYRKRRRKATAG